MHNRQQLREFLSGKARHIHFVGIGGVGMSGLARLLMQQGHRVSGSDLSVNGRTTDLERLGAIIHRGHASRHVPAGAELLVYSSAVSRANEELQVAQQRQILTVRRGELLAALMNHKVNIAVAGTHGKTTTTAMIAQILKASDSAPTFCVGADVPVLGGNAQCGGGKYFVAEACESDGTLSGYAPEYAVCLNIEADHLDHHGTLAQLQTVFAQFFANTTGTVFYCADCPTCVRLAANLRSAISFGWDERADYRPLDFEPTWRGSRFVVACRDQRLGTVELIIPGRQNVVNALAAVAVTDQLGMPFDKIASALAQFSGAKRRFERKFDADGILVVDDYAHHPTEVQATIAAARSLGYRRMIAVFQPHRYTRVQALREQFATAFAGVDKLYLTDIYSAGEAPIAGVDGQTLAAAVAAAGQTRVEYEPDFDRLTAALLRDVERGDLVLTMGAGDIYRVSAALAERLQPRSPHCTSSSRRSAQVVAELRRVLSDESRLSTDEPMQQHTTFRVGGPAEVWVEPASERDLIRVLEVCHRLGLAVTVIGRGSNLLVRDGGIGGVVIRLRSDAFARAAVDGERLVVSAGATLRAVVRLATEHGLGGLEFLEGIPGSVGGALRMNAGAMGRQMFDVVEWVRYASLSGEVYDAAAADLPVRYRSCPTLANHIALSAILRGQPKPRAAIEQTLRAYAARRRATQPTEPSAGCIFKNPDAMPAGKLVEELRLKGMRIGGASVSIKHGNFIVNDGNATAADILALIELIRDRARRERGIELEPEVVIVGRER